MWAKHRSLARALAQLHTGGRCKARRRLDRWHFLSPSLSPAAVALAGASAQAQYGVAS